MFIVVKNGDGVYTLQMVNNLRKHVYPIILPSSSGK